MMHQQRVGRSESHGYWICYWRERQRLWRLRSCWRRTFWLLSTRCNKDDVREKEGEMGEGKRERREKDAPHLSRRGCAPGTVHTHILVEVGILGSVVLRVYFGTILPIFIEIGSYLVDNEQNICWHSLLETRCIVTVRILQKDTYSYYTPCIQKFLHCFSHIASHLICIYYSRESNSVGTVSRCLVLVSK